MILDKQQQGTEENFSMDDFSMDDILRDDYIHARDNFWAGQFINAAISVIIAILASKFFNFKFMNTFVLTFIILNIDYNWYLKNIRKFMN